MIRVSDLQATARRYTGTGLARGWLDGRMDDLGWARVTVQGYGLGSRPNGRGPHARIEVYRGHLAHDDDEGVNT